MASWSSGPPGSGPSFNQVIVIFLLAVIVVMGALLVFDPQLRHGQAPSQPAGGNPPPQIVPTAN